MKGLAKVKNFVVEVLIENEKALQSSYSLTDEQVREKAAEMPLYDFNKLRRQIEDRLRKDPYLAWEVAKQIGISVQWARIEDLT